MIKTLLTADRSERDSFSIPRSVQESIPVKRVYRDGVWLAGRKHSRTWRLGDVNYQSASEEDQRAIFLAYCGVINSLPTDATAKITLFNRRLDPQLLRKTVLMKERGDRLDLYRRESNQILLDKMAQSNNLVQEKYITLSIPQRKIEDSRAYFRRVEGDLQKSLSRLDSSARPLGCEERLRVLHDFFRPGEEEGFTFDMAQSIRQGVDFRDVICPDSLSFKADYFEMGNMVGRVLFLKSLSSYLKDDLLSELSDFPRRMMLSLNLLPIPTDEAVRDVQGRILAVETDVTRWQQKQNANNNFTAMVPYELEQVREETKEFLDDLTARDQRMVMVELTLVHLAPDKRQLDADTEAIQAIGQNHLCQFATLRYQQEDGLNTVLPYGLRRIKAMRTLTTESAAVLMPFRALEIQDPGGLYYGINAVSKNPILCDRKRLISPHAFMLGVSGSGKSMGMKSTILNIALNTDDDIIIIDAEREYGPLAQALGGEVVEISPNSSHHINPLDLGDGSAYEGENPEAMKSELLMSILEQQMGTGALEGGLKSIIDRCTSNVLLPYLKKGGPAPLLTHWRQNVLQQPEEDAKRIALASEIIVEGTLNIFAHPTNVNMDSRIVALDLYEMGEQLRPTGLVVTLDAIQNRVAQNRKKGKYTWVFVDEVYLFFKYHFSAQFLYKAWKRFRKYAAPMTAATQNVEECLRSETARLMFANSEFLVLYNQAATDQQELAKLLHISDTQLGYITNSPPGTGLLRMGGTLVPFLNTIPKDTELYRLMNTTPGEQ
ncbi:MAG: VirB4-like conjugal transfer ATPase, CD1110 family [Acutalibacter sp.]